MGFLLRSFSFFLFCLLSPALILAGSGTANPIIVPKHSIVLKKQPTYPKWMQLWELARKHAEAGENVRAAELYRQLFNEKSNIEEVLREYALVLMDTGQWESAGGMVQRLIERNPESLEYQLYGGRIALTLKRYKRASQYLGQVYTMEPDGPDALEALSGQIIALQKQGRKGIAYPLMEQRYLLVPHDADSIRLLAQYSLNLGYRAKAKMYFTTLLNEFDGTDIDFFESEPLFNGIEDTPMVLLC